MARVTDLPPDRSNPDSYPTIKGLAGVVEYAAEKLGVELTESRVKRADESGDLASFMVCGKRAFSPIDIQNWILTLRRAPGRRSDSAVSA